MNTLFTIGHSTRAIEEFIGLLRENGVTAVADVRSSPYSRHSPQFNADALQRSLRDHQVHYVSLGEELGARRDEPECYVEDVAAYPLIAKTAAFARGMERLRTGLKSQQIALLCAERDPLTCHRMILVCRHLREECEIVHIIGAGENEGQASAEARLLKVVGLPDRDLFRDREDLIDEAYSIQGDQIAFRRETLVAASPSGAN